jgi:hypothetical protein
LVAGSIPASGTTSAPVGVLALVQQRCCQLQTDRCCRREAVIAFRFQLRGASEFVGKLGTQEIFVALSVA